jgi:succinoglycan biosynthesis transport protein ExoP
MRDASPLGVIWRRKVLIAITFLVVVVTTAVVSKNLEKVYSTHSTLLVAQAGNDQSFDRVQASQAFARSFAEIIASPNIARLVAGRLGQGTTIAEVRNATTFEVVPDTQLLEIQVENPDAARAKRIADTYAEEFIAYSGSKLAKTTQATVSLADTASVPNSPARPKPTLYTLLAAILGLALGVALAFLRDRLDHRLRSTEEVEARFEPPVLARVPRRGRSETSGAAFVEAYRLLRTNLQFATVGRPARSIAVTSGEAGEGKTTTVSQLAIASAEAGLNVIVIEADFRRPALQATLMPDHPEPIRPGFSNYLVGTASVEEIVHPTGLPNISIVPAGPLPPTPSALLDSEFARRMGTELLGLGDLMLFDCPPLSIGADASVMGSWLDGTLMVVDLDGSTDRSVREGLRQLEAVEAVVLGLVLNRDPMLETRSYDYYLPDTKRKSGTKGRKAQSKRRERELASLSASRPSGPDDPS